MSSKNYSRQLKMCCLCVHTQPLKTEECYSLATFVDKAHLQPPSDSAGEMPDGTCSLCPSCLWTAISQKQDSCVEFDKGQWDMAAHVWELPYLDNAHFVFFPQVNYPLLRVVVPHQHCDRTGVGESFTLTLNVRKSVSCPVIQVLGFTAAVG